MSYPEMRENMIRNLPIGRNTGQGKGREENLLIILDLLSKAIAPPNSLGSSRCLKKRVLKASAKERGIEKDKRTLYRYSKDLEEWGCIEIMDDDVWITDFGMRYGIPILEEKVRERKKLPPPQKKTEEKHEPAIKFETVVLPVNLGQPLQQQQQVRHCPQCNTRIPSNRNVCPLCGRHAPFTLTG